MLTLRRSFILVKSHMCLKSVNIINTVKRPWKCVKLSTNKFPQKFLRWWNVLRPWIHFNAKAEVCRRKVSDGGTPNISTFTNVKNQVKNNAYIHLHFKLTKQ